MFTLHTTLAAMPLVGFSASAASINLAWDPSPDPNVTGYHVYYGVASGRYTNKVSVGSSLGTTLTLPAGTTYFFIATASTSNALESPPSAEISAYIAPVVINNLPLAAPSSYQLVEDTGADIVLVGSDPEKATLVYSVVTPPQNGILSGTPPNVTYRPNANFYGIDSFTFKVNDGTHDSVPAQVTLTVATVNDSPTLDSIANVVLNESPGTQTVSLTGITAGAANESDSLTVQAISSNPALIPNPSVSYANSATTALLSFTPTTYGYGTATITVTVNDNQGANSTVTRSFTVNVQPVNQPPTIAPIPNLTLTENAGPQVVTLTGLGAGAPNEDDLVTITAVSSNPGLIPNPAVYYADGGSTGSLVLTPTPGLFGSAVIVVTVDDGTAQNNTVVRQFTVDVSSVNQPPTLNPIADLVLNENSGAQKVSLYGITSGATYETNGLTVTAVSSNPDVIPHPVVNYPGRTMGSLAFTPVPGTWGTATISVTVNDGATVNNTLIREFTVTVNALPRITPIPNQALRAGQQTAAIPFAVSDVESPGSALRVHATSSNPNLLRSEGVVLGGTDRERTLVLVPQTGITGNALVTLFVSDGLATNSTQFQVSVAPAEVPVNTSPTISPIMDLVIAKNDTTPDIGFTVGDAESAPSQLKLSVTSSNPKLLPQAGIALAGADANWAVTLTPLSGQTGESYITVAVTDGQLSAKRSFKLSVLNANGRIRVGQTGGGGLSTTASTDAYSFTATADPGQMFTGWTGSITSTNPTVKVSKNKDANLTAHFAPLRLEIVGTGSLQPNLAAMRNLVAGRTYEVTAVPGTGNVFAHWGGGVSGSAPKIKVVLRPDLLLRATFVQSPFNAAAGSYSGLFNEPDHVQHHSSGYFRFQVSSKGIYSGSLRIGERVYPVSGRFDYLARTTNTIRRLAGNLSLELQLGTGDKADTVSGKLVAATWQAELTGHRAVFNSLKNPAPQAGRYTLVIAGPNQDHPSMGDGYAMITVSSNGLARLLGRLPDHTLLNRSAYLSRNGTWPVYVPLYAGNGSVHSWFSFDSAAAYHLSGALTWTKPPVASARYYPSGLVMETAAVGLPYLKPSGTALLAQTNLQVAFLGGNLAAPFTNDIVLNAKSQVLNLSENRLWMTFNTLNGFYSGRVVDPWTNRTNHFKGVVLQNHNSGSGLVLGTDRTARVTLAP